MPRKKEIAPYSHYFVDEAGDSTLFDRRGKVIVQTNGCSRFFLLGALQVSDPDKLHNDLATLRNELLSDPYLMRVPSMQKRTSTAFHAKDDIPEVRREVFKVLLAQDNLQFYAVVRDKLSVLNQVQKDNSWDPTKRYNPNDLYDKMVSRLFRDRLHQAEEWHLTFASRGSSDRSAALAKALEVAQARAREKLNVTSEARLNVREAESHTIGPLQAADYLLWALQRLYERREDRYISYVWNLCHLVQDIDDQRVAGYGVYYTQKSPIELGKLKPI